MERWWSTRTLGVPTHKPVVCHKRDPSTLFLCGDHSGDDQHNVSSTVWRIRMFRSNAPVSDQRSTGQERPPSIQILVIGAGYAGLLFTMRLAGKVARQHVHVSLVNESDTFTERPRLHQFAANQGVQWRSLPQILRRRNIQFIQGRVTCLDPIHRKIMVEDREPPHQMEYDYLVYALGSETDRKTVPGVAQYAYTLAARGPLGASALRETLPSIEARAGQIVVAGGGA